MLKGIIVFKLVNAGSKSEGVRPFLYQGKGIFQAVWLDGDLSLEGKLLLPFDGKFVEMEGEMNEYDIFVAKKIEETQYDF